MAHMDHMDPSVLLDQEEAEEGMEPGEAEE